MSCLPPRSCGRLLRQANTLLEKAGSNSTSIGRAHRTRVSARRSLTTDGRRLVLGIESSCDDSCAALVSAPQDYADAPGLGHRRARVHNSVVYKQDHARTKGVQPLEAANGHSSHVPLAIRDALKKGQEDGILQDANSPLEIDAIAVTQGPGMAGCLSQGLSCAKLLSALWDRPLLHVHHMAAHALTPFMRSEHSDTSQAPLRFPFLVFLLSGGHTQLVLCTSLTEFRILVNCPDNSIGNAFDRVAKALQVPFEWSKTAPGAALEAFAEGGEQFVSQNKRYDLPVPCQGETRFSYSGLIVQTERVLEKSLDIKDSEEKKRALAFAFQRAAFAQLEDKLKMGLLGDSTTPALCGSNADGTAVRDIVVSGGVASNQALRRALQTALDKISEQQSAQAQGKSKKLSEYVTGLITPQKDRYRLHFPPIALCTDNAAMIAHAGLLRWNPTFDLTAKPRAKWLLDNYQG